MSKPDFSTDPAHHWPDVLPATPTGWTKRMGLHLNLGGGQGKASYEIRTPDGHVMPFSFAYHSGSKKREENYAGFILPGHQDKALTWKELGELWPAWLAAHRAQA